MKKLILLLNLIFLSKSILSSENNKWLISRVIDKSAVYVLLKICDLTEAVSKNAAFQKLYGYIDISDHSLSSDELIIIVPKGENNFEIKFINLYKLNKLKNKFVIPHESDEISKELYDKIKKLSVPVDFFYENGQCNIKLPDNQTFHFKTEVCNVEAVILPNAAIGEIVKEIDYIENANNETK